MIAIVVPVLRRAHQIEPLLKSIEEGTSDVDHRVVFVCSPEDKEALGECLASDADTITTTWEAGRSDFAKKVNLAYELTEEEWIFQAATDLVFHPGWASTALAVARRNRVGVVGTNDMGNPLVKRGHHSTHTLFSREYIEEYGGTHDNTGKVFSEAYEHQFVDTEFIQTAIMRGQFSPSLRSIVEHLHPHWGKGEMDETYKKATRDLVSDSEIYNNRMRFIRREMGVGPPARARPRPGFQRR